jgi:hypothetical protein
MFWNLVLTCSGCTPTKKMKEKERIKMEREREREARVRRRRRGNCVFGTLIFVPHNFIPHIYC